MAASPRPRVSELVEDPSPEVRTRWAELGFAAVALFVLTRSPVLFLRQKTAGTVGGAVAAIWQDDPLVRSAFLAVELVAIVLAARCCRLRDWARQPLLVAFLAMAVVSITWSVEPGTTQLRSMMLLGTAAFGWWFGVRLHLRDQLLAVALASALGAVLSVVALVAYPTEAKSTNGVAGEWSGVYVNRNLLGAAMAIGLMATAFLVTSWPRRRGPCTAAAAAAAIELLLLAKSGTRTSLVAGAAAAGACGLALAARQLRRRDVRPEAAAAATAGVALLGGAVVHGLWDRIVSALGRDPSLTRRTTMWDIDRFFIKQRPWRGFGFEAIWTNQASIDKATESFGVFPYQAHNGYFELQLSLGKIGFAIFIGFLAMALWWAFRAAYLGQDLLSLWPIAIIVFAVVGNFSEGFFVANEQQLALTIAASFTAAGYARGAPARTAR